MTKKVIAVIIGILDAALLGVIIVSAATGWRIGGSSGTQPNAVQSGEKATSAPAEAQTEDDEDDYDVTEAPELTEAPTQMPTEAPTAAPTEAPTEAPKSLPYIDSLGAPQPKDFTWAADVLDGKYPSNKKMLSNDDILGKWKAEFFFGDMWELVYITIDENANVTVDSYQINYGKGWESEYDMEPYSLSGRFDVAGVVAEGETGKMVLGNFYETDGRQYGIGSFELTYSGDKISVALIRP